jgi:DNA-binding LacI/PurR family transcriptional regulator
MTGPAHLTPAPATQRGRGAHRPTLEEVAAHAGVSRATVSRVVNGVATVDPAIAATVTASIDALNYVPNQAARALMTRRTNALALVAAEPDTRVFGDPFFAGIVRGVSQELTAIGMQLVVSMVQSPEDVRRVETYLLGKPVDGVLLISEHGHHHLASTLVSHGIPLVIGGRPLDTDLDVAYVDNDNVEGAAVATRHLRSLGRSRIATIAGPLDMSAGLDRLDGFTAALGDAFDPGLVEHGDFTTDGGMAAASRLLARAPDVDGLFVASDLMAIGALATLRRAGRRVPEDVAVVGFDDIPLAAASVPALTTVRQRTELQGRAMARVLLASTGRQLAPSDDLPDVGSDGVIVLPVELVVRDTA